MSADKLVLNDLVQRAGLNAECCRADIRITGLAGDSRQVQPGFLFAALPGVHAHGRDFIADALRNDAAAVLCAPGDAIDLENCACVICYDDIHMAYARLAAAFYNRQPGTIAAVTGTNGKTSCVCFIRQMWQALGCRAASYGTLGIQSDELIRAPGLTTPDAGALHRDLADCVDHGIERVALEASSHGLDQRRLDGVRITVAGFTNLSREHLDYHSDMQAYFAAKARLFDELLPAGGTAVINADDQWGQTLVARCRERGLDVVTYGEAGDNLRLVSRTPRPGGQALSLYINGCELEADLPLAGGFQAANALCALGMVIASGDLDSHDMPHIRQVLGALAGAPGRLEPVSGHPRDAAVYVDYAHAPGALETVLTELRAHARHRLICVVGCGGERDTGKRAIMGRIGASHADHVIITDDNPRGEDPALIRKQMLEGAPAAEEIGDRRAAIERAIAMAGPGDVVLIAGKGHEQGQIYADHIVSFDDRDVASTAMLNTDKSSPP